MPPEIMVNKDFLKDILASKKKLLKKDDVKFISLPNYKEVTVKTLWPHFKHDPNFSVHFPAKFPTN